MSADQDELLLHTLELLNARMKRLELLFDGSVDTGEKTEQNVAQRLRKMEEAVNGLANKSKVVNDVLALQAKHPDIFKEAPSNKDNLNPAEALSMVLAEAPQYPAIASQLNSLIDLPVPSSEAFANLIALQPRMVEIAGQQAQQQLEISELRKKTALLMLRYHEVLILSQGRCWVEWDDRLRKAERTIRREEVRHERDEQGI